MKISKIFGIFVALVSLSMFSGCIAAAPFIAPMGLALSGASAAASVHQEITRADEKLSLNMEMEKVPGIAETAFKELGINFKETKIAQDGKSITILGEVPKKDRSGRDLRARILAVKLTDKIVNVGVWTTQENSFGDIRKPELAGLIKAQLFQQAELAKKRAATVKVEAGDKKQPTSEVKKNPAPEPEKAPAPVKKPAAKKKPVVKKKPASKKQQPATGKGG